MRKNRGVRGLAIVAIIIALVGLTIGYSALQATLNISTQAKLKGSQWSVHFVTSSLSEPTLVGDAAVVNAATLAVTSITIDVSLTKPLDSVTYTFDVTNDGELNAKLNAAPTITGLDAATANNVTYALTYNDGSAIQANDTLNVNETKKLKLTVFMNDVSTVQAADVPLTFTATLLYTQI